MTLHVKTRNNAELEVGDVVTFPGTNIDMTVDNIDGYNVTCKWFFKDHLNIERFNILDIVRS